MFWWLPLSLSVAAPCGDPTLLPVSTDTRVLAAPMATQFESELRLELPFIGAQLCSANAPTATILIERSESILTLKLFNADTGRSLAREIDASSLPPGDEGFALATLAVEMLRGSWFSLPISTLPPLDAEVDAISGSRESPIWLRADATPAAPPKRSSHRIAPRINVLASYWSYNGGLKLIGSTARTSVPLLDVLSAFIGAGAFTRAGGRLLSESGDTQIQGWIVETGARLTVWSNPWLQSSVWASAELKRLRFSPRAENDSPANARATGVDALVGVNIEWCPSPWVLGMSFGGGYPLRKVEVFDIDATLESATGAFFQAALIAGLHF